MLDTQSIKVQGLKGLSRTEMDAMVAQLLSHIDEQERHIGEQGKRLDSAQQAIKWRDAKIEKITFELARLKAWKFGAKSERMSAELPGFEPGELEGDLLDLRVAPLDRLLR